MTKRSASGRPETAPAWAAAAKRQRVPLPTLGAKLNALDHFFFGGCLWRSDFVILFQTRPMSYLLIQICR